MGHGAETRLIWLGTGTGGRLLSAWYGTTGFHMLQEVSWLAEELLASEEGLSSMELVHWTFYHGVTSECGENEDEAEYSDSDSGV